MEEKDMIEIDLWELFCALRKKIWMILGVGAACAVLALLISVLVMRPQYTASTRAYILNRTNESTIVYADIQTSTYMLYDYQALITGQNVTREVIRDLKLNMTAAQLAGCIEVSAETNTRVLQIDVTYEDPQLAADIANRIREVAAEQIKTFMEVDAVKTVYEAEAPAAPSGPNVRRNTLIGLVCGMLVCAAVYTVRFILDDTIRTEEDVQTYLGLSVLGVIPESEELRVMGSHPVKKRGRAKR